MQGVKQCFRFILPALSVNLTELIFSTCLPKTKKDFSQYYVARSADIILFGEINIFFLSINDDGTNIHTSLFVGNLFCHFNLLNYLLQTDIDFLLFVSAEMGQLLVSYKNLSFLLNFEYQLSTLILYIRKAINYCEEMVS